MEHSNAVCRADRRHGDAGLVVDHQYVYVDVVQTSAGAGSRRHASRRLRSSNVAEHAYDHCSSLGETPADPWTLVIQAGWIDDNGELSEPRPIALAVDDENQSD